MSKKHKANLPAKPAGGMALAAKWPVFEVLLSQGWDQEGQLAIILIARRSPMSGKVAAGSFLVDLACLGAKSVQVKLYKDAAEYQAGLRRHVMGMRPMAPAAFDLAAKIILTGLEYAAALGFKPDPVYAQAEHLLADANPAASPVEVRTGGSEGKPFFINGPYDNVDRIMAQLVRAVGPEGFHYLLGNPETDDFE